MHEHFDVLREAARRLGRTDLAEALAQWAQQRPQGDFRVAFVGRGPAKTQLIHRLLELPEPTGDPVGVPVRFDHGASGPVTVHFADGSSADTSLPGLSAALADRDAIVARTTIETVPVGVQWCDTPAVGTFGRAVDQATLEAMRFCDATILTIAAEAPDDADLAILERGAVRDGHVPVIGVVLTGVAELAPDAATALLTRVAEVLHRICADAVVLAEPAPGSVEHAAWRRSFLAAQPPHDLDRARRSQSGAQLRDIGERLVSAAEDCAVDEHRLIGTDTAVLAEVQTRAEWLLDAAGVRRELQARHRRVLADATRDLERLGLDLIERAERLLAVSSGAVNDATHVPQDLRVRADTALIRVRENYHRGVTADIAWLDARLRAYFEAWSHGRVEPHRPAARAGSGPVLERYLPRLHPAWATRVAATPLEKFAEVSVEIVGQLAADPQRRGATAARLFAVEALTARRPGGAPAADAATARTATDAVRYATVAVAVGGSLDAVTARLYGGLADEFDTQRRRWRRIQIDGADRIRRAAYAEWLALADQLRDLLDVTAGDATRPDR